MNHFVATISMRWDNTAKNLLPAYFAMVMATGIVSIAAYIYSIYILSQFLFYVDFIGYIVLWILSIYRVIVYSGYYLRDLEDHSRAPGFFTVIAGTNTLGSVFFVVEKNYTAAFDLWLFGLILWFFYQYFIFVSLSLSKNKPSLENGINGAWLIAIVSTQSVAVLAAQLSPIHSWMYIFSLVFYMIGWLTYVLVMSLINYRLLFMKLNTNDLTGPYWINMGATAITTLAGVLIFLNGNASGFVSQSDILRQFLLGSALLMWAYGSWWIPWLLIVGILKYTKGRESLLNYDPLFWGGVFPMGMYTVSTYFLAKASGFKAFLVIPELFIYIAIAAWLYEFIGLIHSVVSGDRLSEENTVRNDSVS
jgi:tellurite resistance protein TehA-like permease